MTLYPVLALHYPFSYAEYSLRLLPLTVEVIVPDNSDIDALCDLAFVLLLAEQLER